jgi:hypothetical protein
MRNECGRFLSLLPCLLLSLLPGSVQAQAFADVQAELVHNDNLTRAERDVDVKTDSAAAVTVIGGIRLQPGTYTGLTFTGTLNRTQFRRYTGLSSWEAGLYANLSHKFGIGDRAPTLSLEIGAARNEYNRGLRDAWVYRADLRLQKRLTSTFNLSGGLRYEERDGDHNVPRVIPIAPRPGNSWDVRSHGFFLSAEQDLGAATWVSAMYQLQDGDVVSTSAAYLKIFNTATAITLDPLYGAAAVAYRIPAHTHVFALDLNRAVFDSSTLYLGFEYQQTHGRNGIDYDVGLVRSGFIHSF